MDSSTQQLQIQDQAPPVIQQQNNTPYIAPQPNHNTKKWLQWVFLLVFIVVLLVGGGYYFLSNQKPKTIQYPKSIVEKMNKPTVTPDSTADWQIYTNTEYGYIITYPKELYVSHQGGDEKDGYVEFSKFPITENTTNLEDIGYSISVFFDENEKNLLAQDWWKERVA